MGVKPEVCVPYNTILHFNTYLKCAFIADSIGNPVGAKTEFCVL